MPSTLNKTLLSQKYCEVLHPLIFFQLFGYVTDGLSTVFLTIAVCTMLGASEEHIDILWCFD